MTRKRQALGFTLVELVVVMALLAIAAAIAAPSLSRSMRQRHVDGEATRFLAATEYARDEAVSQGIPMVVWFDPKSTRFGVKAKSGFEGDESRTKEFSVNPDLSYEVEKGDMKDGVIEAIEFSASGAPATRSVESVVVKDRFESVVTVVKTTDGWSYEIVKEGVQ